MHFISSTILNNCLQYYWNQCKNRQATTFLSISQNRADPTYLKFVSTARWNIVTTLPFRHPLARCDSLPFQWGGQTLFWPSMMMSHIFYSQKSLTWLFTILMMSLSEVLWLTTSGSISKALIALSSKWNILMAPSPDTRQHCALKRLQLSVTVV